MDLSLLIYNFLTLHEFDIYICFYFFQEHCVIFFFPHLNCCTLKIVFNIGTMGALYLFCQVYSEWKRGLTARNSLAFVIFGLWWKRPLLTHNTADPDVRIFLNFLQKWWRVMKESVTCSAENRLCRKSRHSRLLSLVPLSLLQRVYDVVKSFAVSWIRKEFLPDCNTISIFAALASVLRFSTPVSWLAKSQAAC